jgi:hypothetical protein
MKNKKELIEKLEDLKQRINDVQSEHNPEIIEKFDKVIKNAQKLKDS